MDEIEDGDGAKGIIINNEFQIIDNLITQNTQMLHDFCETLNTDSIHDHPLVRIRNKILMFGGGHISMNTNSDNIYDYDINGNKWKKLNCKMPKALKGYGWYIHIFCV